LNKEHKYSDGKLPDGRKTGVKVCFPGPELAA